MDTVQETGEYRDPAADLLTRWLRHRDAEAAESPSPGHRRTPSESPPSDPPPSDPPPSDPPPSDPAPPDATGDESSPPSGASPLVAAIEELTQRRVADIDDRPAEEAPGAGEEADPAGRAEESTNQATEEPARSADRVEFRGGGSSAAVTSILLIAIGVMMTGGLGYLAFESRSAKDLGLTAAAAVLTMLAVLARRRSGGSARVVIDAGRLSITRGDSVSSFDLRSPALDAGFEGDPSDRTWRFVIQRRSLGAITIDRSMVDPRRFTEAVRAYRPQA